MNTFNERAVLKRGLLSEGLFLDSRIIVPCKICNHDSVLFDVVDFLRTIHPDNYPFGLSSIPIYFYRCKNCGLVFNNAFNNFTDIGWSKYIYNDEYYSKIDLDYNNRRPNLDAQLLFALSLKFGKKRIFGLDYGGGNGKLASLLSEKKINYFSYDPFDYSTIYDTSLSKFNLISAFEVLEHTTNPLETFRRIVRMGTDKFVLVVSTQTNDGLIDDKKRLSWNYVAPRNGHVTVYSKYSLSLLAEKFELKYLSVSRGLHLFSRGISLFSLKYLLAAVKVKQRIYF